MATGTTTSAKAASDPTTAKPRKDLVTKVGNIGSVEEDGTIKLRITQSGKSVCNFDIAVTTGRGEEKRTEWYKITCWDSLADNVVACLTKGHRVIVWGVPDIEEFTDAQGNARKKKTINAWSVGVDLNFQQASIQKIERTNTADYDPDEPF